MKKALSAVIALACAGVLLAKDQPAQQAPAAAKPAAAQAKPSEEQEDSGVFIDSAKYEPEDDDSGAGAPYAAAGVPGGIPSSYGQCRGVLSEGGRSLLVFESLDDGAISLVQVTFGKTGVGWKLAGRMPRSGE